MKKSLSYIAMIALSLIFCACDDNRSVYPATNPGIALPESSEVVTREQLIKALDANEEAEDKALCVAESALIFGGMTSLTIEKVLNVGQGKTRFQIIAPINIVIPADGRAETCGDGSIGFIVTATAEMPIKIEIDTLLSSRHSLTPFAREGSGIYPDKCEIRAHFETTNICLDEDGHQFEIAEGEECETEEPHDIKLVVDDYYCQTRRKTYIKTH